MASVPLARTCTSSRRTIFYPIGGDEGIDERGGAIFTFGNPSSRTIVLLSAGYPDDHGTFLPFAERLAKETGSYCGVTCLAGYDDRPQDGRPWAAHKRDGYTLNEMAAGLRDAGRALRASSTYNNGRAKFTVIFHDWAVPPGMKYVNRALEDAKLGQSETGDVPDDVVLFDVLVPIHPDTKNPPPPATKSPYQILMELTYRLCFAASFLMQRYIHRYAGLLCLGISISFLKLFNLMPTGNLDAKTMEKRQPPLDPNRMIYMAYPYWGIFKSLLTGNIEAFSGCTIPLDLSKTPVLYLYGTDKRIMFDDEQVHEHVRREGRKPENKSDAIAVDNAGHWLYRHQEDCCIDHVKKFILS